MAYRHPSQYGNGPTSQGSGHCAEDAEPLGPGPAGEDQEEAEPHQGQYCEDEGKDLQTGCS